MDVWNPWPWFNSLVKMAFHFMVCGTQSMKLSTCWDSWNSIEDFNSYTKIFFSICVVSFALKSILKKVFSLNEKSVMAPCIFKIIEIQLMIWIPLNCAFLLNMYWNFYSKYIQWALKGKSIMASWSISKTVLDNWNLIKESDLLTKYSFVES